MKTCSKCGVPKEGEAFSIRASTGRPRAECKSCGVKLAGDWAKKNRDACNVSGRRYRKINLEKSRESARNAARTRRAVKAATKRLLPVRPLQTLEEGNAARREKRKRDPENVRKKNRDYYARRSGSDPRYRIGLNLRSRVTIALRRALAKKSINTFSLLGCPVVWLQAHLESLFIPGMTWENYGPVWHVDHIKPCAAFDLRDPEKQKACFHWTNLQPLFAADNLRKNDTYDGP